MKRSENALNRRKTALNRRGRTILGAALACVLLILICAAGVLWQEEALATDLARKNLAPCAEHWFGTDFMGRDMLVRTVVGLSMSIRLGAVTAAASALLAALLGIGAAVLGKAVDAAVSWFIDLVMGIPHILLLILISFAVGKGFFGVALGITLTHWTSLARILRGEVLQLSESQYVKMARKLGHGPGYVAVIHMFPHVLPQWITGLILLFPHAVLHEASITFLGFGLSSEQPAIGIILSESMKYLSMGYWWLSLLPGAMLVAVILLFHWLGRSVCQLLDPASAHV